MSQRRDARIDGLRGVAALTVVLPHTALLLADGNTPNATSSMSLGFTLLFVISGLLLYLPFVHEVVRGDRGVDLAAYTRNRCLRLLPAPAVVLAAGLALQVAPVADPWLLLPLPVFALVLPLLWHLARLLDDEEHPVRAVITPGLLLLAVGVVGLALDNLLGHAVPFAVGMIAAGTTVGMTGRRTVRKRVWSVRRGALTILGVSLALTLPVTIPESLHRFQPAMMAVATAAALTVLRLPGQGLRRYLNAMFDTLPLRHAGRVSAGLVLWHVPLALAVREYRPQLVEGSAESFLLAYVVVVGASWVAAHVTWRLLERPLQHASRPVLLGTARPEPVTLPEQRLPAPATELLPPSPLATGGKHRADLPAT